MLPLESINQALSEGLPVHWKNKGYVVYKDGLGRLMLTYTDNGYTNYLLDSDIEDCFIGDQNVKV